MMRTWSSGGGIQSIAGLVLSAQKVINFPVHLFCNVGDDSENPDTLEYMHDVAMPYARRHGIKIIELRREFKSKKYREAYGTETLLQRMYRTPKSIPIPIRRSGGFPLSRSCTIDYKISVILDWLKASGATAENPALTAIGFSVDEWSRLRSDSGCEWQKLTYPLFEMRLTRADCVAVIRDAGLPIPPKSSCWFCPHTQHAEWVRMANEKPELFEKACGLEKFLSQKYGEPLFLHKYLAPLETAVHQYYFDIDDTQECAGYCWL